MSLMQCRSCPAKYVVGLLRCPRCQTMSELFTVTEKPAGEEESTMPKITVGGGASNAAEDVEEAPVAAEPAVEVPADEAPVADEPVAEPVQEEPAVEAEAPATKEAAPAPKARKKASQPAS